MDFGPTLGPSLAHVGAFGPILRSLWRHFGVTLESLWGHFGYIRMTLGHFRMTLGSLWNHFGCIRVDFQKTFIFPIDFNDFIKLWG